MKLKVSNVLDLSKYLQTKTGQELRGLLEYVAKLGEEIVTALTSNLSYGDNFSAELKKITLRDGIREVIKISKPDVGVKEIRVRRIYDDEFFVIQSFGWSYNSQSEIIVELNFAGSPSLSREFEVDLLIFYG
tara:strand:+ start:3541 stop:3936 length:396 start_codon:yes stop_codon:yes gene_type:complete